MQFLIGPFYVLCAIVAVAGAAKLLSPAPTSRALKTVGLPHHLLVVRGLGLSELVVASLAVAAGGRVFPALMAVLYFGFAAFITVMVQRERRGEGVASCGCFGVTDTTPGAIHLVTNVIAASIAAASAVIGLDQASTVIGQQPAAGIPFVGYVLLGTFLTYVVLTALPEIQKSQFQKSPEVARSFSINRPATPAATSPAGAAAAPQR